MATRKRKRRESFGSVRKLPSGRYQASYVGPDQERHTAPSTFDGLTDARAWLAEQQAALLTDQWRPPRSKQTSPPFEEYARSWINTRTKASTGELLAPSTREEYARFLRIDAFAKFARMPIAKITPTMVREWHRLNLDTGKKTQAAKYYGFLKSVLATAVDDGLISANPCKVRGGTKASTGKRVEPPTRAELEIITATIDPRLSLMVEVAAWGGLRYSEITELRRADISFQDDVAILAIVRAVTFSKEKKEFVVGPPKNDAVRDVALPSFLTNPLRAHLAALDSGDETLIFPSFKDPRRHMNSGTFHTFWRPARAAAGREDMPFHATRHFGATRYAMTGATTKEIMARMGHKDIAVAMRYQHAVGRDAELARRMGDFV